MVFVFGIDIPLVEMIFVLTLVLIGLFGLMIYIIIKQYRLNQRLGIILNKENIELSNLKDIRKEEKTEARLLGNIRNEIDKLIYGEIYGKKIESLMNTKKGKTNKNKVKRLTWTPIWTRLNAPNTGFSEKPIRPDKRNNLE